MGNIFKLSAILFFVGGIAAGMLAFYNSFTKPEIENLKAQNEAEARQYVMKGLFPDESLGSLIFDEDEIEMNGKPEKFWKVREKETDQYYKAFVFLSKGQGFSGVVETMVGTDAAFKINRIKVLKHTETPGLGAESQTVKYADKQKYGEDAQPFFETWFTGKNSLKVVVEKDDSASPDKVHSITGATITTRAVCKSINKYAEAVKAKMDKPPVIYVDPENIISVEEVLKKAQEDSLKAAESAQTGTEGNDGGAK